MTEGQKDNAERPLQYQRVFDQSFEDLIRVLDNDDIPEKHRPVIIEHIQKHRDAGVEIWLAYRQWQWDARRKDVHMLKQHESALGINALHTLALVTVAALAGFFGLVGHFAPKVKPVGWEVDVKFVVIFLLCSVVLALLASGLAWLSQFRFSAADEEYEIHWEETKAVTDRKDRDKIVNQAVWIRRGCIATFSLSLISLLVGGVWATQLLEFGIWV